MLLHNDRFLALSLKRDGPTAALVGKQLKEVRLPTGVLVALVHRDGDIAVPSGSTVLEAGDRLTMLGDPEGIRQLEVQYRK
ncbi:MAG: TrkA C-terminal domain-containing protein [Bacteroidota bacterium]